MATQYTPILQLALPVTGELNGTWGDVVNDNITSMVEQAIAGLATISTWTANSHTLTTANGTTDEARCAMLLLQTGAGGTALTGAGQVICPALTKLYVVKNDAAYAVTVKTSGGSGVSVSAGDTTFVFCDGTNVVACVTQITNGHITGNLTVDGNTQLGNATSDTITATARIASDLNPSADNTYDLGTSGNSWRNLYIDGTATIATLNVTTIDTTNLEVTNIKAKDGTASITLADSTGVATLSVAPVLNAGTANQVQFLNGSKQLVGDADLTFDGTTLSATNITSSGTVTLSGGTANGVAYLNGSEVLTTGSALTFDGSDFATTGSVILNNAKYYYGKNTSGGLVRLLGVTAGNVALVGPVDSGPTDVTFSAATTVTNQQWYIGGSEQMRLTSTGLGIGTSSPNGKLDVNNGAIVLSNSGSYIGGMGRAAGILGVGSNTDIAVTTSGATNLMFGTNSTERMRLDSSGNLGLGVTPSAWNSSVKALQGPSGFGSFYVDNGYYGAAGLARNCYWTASSGTSWNYVNTQPALRYEMGGSAGLGTHAWFIAPSGTAGNAISFTQAMTLDASGNLGIGTSSPSSKLQVVASSAEICRFNSSAANGGYQVIYTDNSTPTYIGALKAITGGGTAADFSIIGTGANNLMFGTNSTERMRIDSSGNLGLGVTPSAWRTPSFQFGAGGVRSEQYSAGNLQTKILSNGYEAAGTGYYYIATDYASMYNQIAGTHAWYLAPSGTAGNAISFTQAMTLDASGNLMVGTTDAYGTLTVQRRSAAPNSTITLGDIATPANGVGIYARVTDSGNAFTISSAGAPIRFSSDGGSSERMRIDSSGNLLIGYTSSNGSYKLQVNSQIFATSSTIATSDANYKENVTPLSGALDVVAALNPVQFNWKHHEVHNFDTETPTVGFIAQEVQQVLADAPFVNSLVKESEVTLPDGEKEKFLGIAEGNMIAILTKAIQELKAEFDAYKATHP